MAEINFEVNNLTNSRVDKGFLERVGKKILETLSFSRLGIGEISLAIVGDKRIRTLNKKYRRRNQVTDVLAFDYGEIFICLPQAKSQAKKLGHSLKEELAILLIHGLLHLSGYSDETKKDYNKMVKAQEKIFAEIKNKIQKTKYTY